MKHKLSTCIFNPYFSRTAYQARVGFEKMQVLICVSFQQSVLVIFLVAVQFSPTLSSIASTKSLGNCSTTKIHCESQTSLFLSKILLYMYKISCITVNCI